MSLRFSLRAITVSSILPLATAVMAIAIFVFDTITDLEIAVAAFYVVVVLVSVTFCQRRGIMLISAGCLTLTLLSYFLTRTGDAQPGLINSLISLTAIAATTYLALKIVAIDTEIQASRERLAHVARVITLGELTASIAHEVNQPLAAVVTNANACSRWLAADPPNLDEATKAIDRIVRDGNRASNVVARVRSLAKRASPDRAWVNLNEVILEVVAIDPAGLPSERNFAAHRSRGRFAAHLRRPCSTATGGSQLGDERHRRHQGQQTGAPRYFDRLGSRWRQQDRGDGPRFRHRA